MEPFPEGRFVIDTLKQFVTVVHKVAGRGKVVHSDYGLVVVYVPMWYTGTIGEILRDHVLFTVSVIVKRLSVWDHIFLWSTLGQGRGQNGWTINMRFPWTKHLIRMIDRT